MKTKLIALASWGVFLVSAILEYALDIDFPLTPTAWLVISMCALMAVTTHAATTNSWKVTSSGKWETSGNWSAHAPAASDGIELITNAATKTITIDATTASATNTLSISNLYVAGTATSTNTLFLNNVGTNTPLQIVGGAFAIFTIETNASLVVNGSSIVATTNGGTTLTIGNHGGHSSLIISNAGVVFCDSAKISGNNNTAMVTGPGSVWNFRNDFDVGLFGTGNTFTVSNGGVAQVLNPGAITEVSGDPSSRSNVVVITGPGSVWKGGADLLFGQEGPGNLLTITNGGRVVASIFQVGGGFPASNNIVLVTGTGSVLSNSNTQLGEPGELIIGNQSVGNTLIIASGGEVISGGGGMGFFSSSSSNALTVTGPGSVWNLISFNIGLIGGGNKVTITNSGMVLASNLVVGYSRSAPSNNLLQVSGGSLFATTAGGTGVLEIGPSGLKNRLLLDSGSVTVDNLISTNSGGAIISLNGGTLTAHYADISNGLDFIIGGTNTSATYVANGGTQFFKNNLVVQRGTFTMNGGNVTVNQLILTNANTTAEFDGGEFNSPGTFVTNGAQFVIGNGAAHANFHLLGGVHNFNNGVRVSNGASLTGCGTINGNVTIDVGGSIFATCGALTFTGTVTNNGALAANGAALEFYGTVVNNNGLLFYNGGTTNFHGAFISNGIITNAGPVIITSITRTGNDVVVTAPSALDFDYQLQIANTQNSPIWTNSGAIQPGTGADLTFTDPGGATNRPNRYYQVDVIWPP